jgi:hypothetical protein
MQHKVETRKRFVEGEGWIVEDVPVGTPTEPGQAVVSSPEQPPAPVVVVASQVTLAVAQEVIAAHGMVAVPFSFLNAEQLEELGKEKEETVQPDVNGNKSPEYGDTSTMKADQAIVTLQLAADFNELNALTANETRKTVLAAAEARAEELKEAGKE